LFCIVEELLIEDGEVVEEDVDDGEVAEEDVDDGEVEDGEVEDGDVLDGYCELLGVDEDDEEDELWSDDDVCANAPQAKPAAQRSVMILVA